MFLPVRVLAVLAAAAASVYAATAVLPVLIGKTGTPDTTASPSTARHSLNGLPPMTGLTGLKPPTIIPGRMPEGAFTPVDETLEKHKLRYGHEARLHLHGDAGELSTGRLAGLSGRTGAYALFSRTGDALGGASPVRTGLFRFPVMNNMVALGSRTVNGVTAYALHSFGVEDVESARYSENDRYLGLAISYESQGSAASITLEQGLPSRTKTHAPAPFLVGLAANTEVGGLRLYGGLQYGRHLSDDITTDDADIACTDARSLAGTLGLRYALDRGELRMAAYHGRAGFNGLTRTTTGIGFLASGTIAPDTYGWLSAGASRTELSGTDQRLDRLSVRTGLTRVF